MKLLKNSAWFFLLAGTGFIAWSLQGSLFNMDPHMKDQVLDFFKHEPAPLTGPVEDRESITFILSRGDEAEPDYFSQAENYYRHHPTEHTEQVISQCHSLLEVRDYLATHQPANRMPWGRVNLVVHGNEWSGLGIPVLPEGRRTTADVLLAAVESGNFRPLPEYLADACTELQVHGCAVGKDTELLHAISKAFGGQGERPAVVSPPYFINYQSGKGTPEKKLLEPWYAFYPKTYRPDDGTLVNQLQHRYPDACIDWQDALTRTKPSSTDEIYHYTFDVPILWIVPYPDEASLPALEKWKDQKAWLNEQSELLDLLKSYDMERNLFQWTFLKIKHRLDDGREVPAIKAIGLCTVLTVLRPPAQPQQKTLIIDRPIQKAPDFAKY